jgi:hypothetical protein
VITWATPYTLECFCGKRFPLDNPQVSLQGNLQISHQENRLVNLLGSLLGNLLDSRQENLRDSLQLSHQCSLQDAQLGSHLVNRLSNRLHSLQVTQLVNQLVNLPVNLLENLHLCRLLLPRDNQLHNLQRVHLHSLRVFLRPNPAVSLLVFLPVNLQVSLRGNHHRTPRPSHCSL